MIFSFKSSITCISSNFTETSSKHYQSPLVLKDSHVITKLWPSSFPGQNFCVKCCCIKPDSQYDASTISITSVMNIYLRKNLNFSWSNVFLDVQKCDNLISWTLEMLHTHHWSRNQFIPPSPWCLRLQHWCQRHNYCEVVWTRLKTTNQSVTYATLLFNSML